MSQLVGQLQPTVHFDVVHMTPGRQNERTLASLLFLSQLEAVISLPSIPQRPRHHSGVHVPRLDSAGIAVYPQYQSPPITMDPSVRSFAPRATRPSPIVTSATAGPPNIHSPFRSSATALFGQEDSIWGSPLPEATRSAAMPDKAPWSGDVLRSSGLGINVGNKQQSFTPVTPSPLRLFHSTTPSSTHFPNNTYPLMQQEFGTPRQLADQPRLRGTPPSAATTTSSKMEDTDEFSSPVSIQPEVSPHHAAGSEVSPHDTEDGISVIGAISPHYLDTYPELAGQHAPVFRQATHPQGWKRVTTTPGARVDEAFKGAHEIVRGLNPDLFS